MMVEHFDMPAVNIWGLRGGCGDLKDIYTGTTNV